MGLTSIQVMQTARAAGWTGQDLLTAGAVCWAESSGNPNAHNTSGGADARGLWQINVARNAHPEYASQNMYDPKANAAAAYAIWKRDGWGPWQAHNNGSYLLYLPMMTSAATAAGGLMVATDPVGSAKEAAGQVADTVGGIADVPGALLQAVEEPVKILAWLTQSGTQIRIAKVVVGAGLVMLGLYVFARPVVDPAVKTIGKAAVFA